MTAPRRNNAKITLRMQTALKANGHTYDDLVLVSGLAKESVARWVKQMRELGVVRVCAWNDDVRGRRIVPVFQWGTEPDLPRPGRRWTAAETMARMRARRKAEAQALVRVFKISSERKPCQKANFQKHPPTGGHLQMSRCCESITQPCRGPNSPLCWVGRAGPSTARRTPSD